MIMLNNQILTNLYGYSSLSLFVQAIQKDLSDSLNLLYSIQNEINLS